MLKQFFKLNHIKNAQKIMHQVSAYEDRIPASK